MALRQPDALQNERRVLERQVAHMTRLVDDLLDVSRFARGKVQLKREPLDLREIVMRAVEMVQPLLDRRAEPVKVELPPQPVWVAGDAVRLAQVFSNLLSNAAKFTPFDGRIAIRLTRRDAEVDVTVEDGGAGIAPELLPRVFELFVQGRQAPDRQVGGLGLGLAIVRTLVELHGGNVRAASEGEGRGSRFTVTLPRALHGRVSSTLTAPAPLEPPNARRILLVDDNHDALEMMAQLLRSAGHEVHVAGPAAQALALLEHWTPSLALLDIGLPGMDGFDLARRLRSDPRWRSLPLVAVTGYGHESDRERALDAGFDEHLVKPVDAQALAAVIERLASVPTVSS
jgi:CheY-like chemotaxis protein/two-component sensor histidine kinase